MPSAAWMRAMLSTARITGIAGLAISAPACTKSPAPNPATAPSTPAEVRPETASDTPDPGPALLDTPATEPRALSADEIAACHTAWSDDGVPELTYEDFNKRLMGGPAPTASAESVACCAADIIDQPRWGCCAISAQMDMLACTPWGPPAPPAMA